MTFQARVVDAVNDLRSQLVFRVDGTCESGKECGETLMPDGGSFALCTRSARYLQQKLGGRVMGYFHWNNPTAELGETEGGHDFLVVQGMIVDLWASDYYDSPVVVHLKHEDTVRRLYGDPNRWVVVPA